jgi:hypothetical protein
MAQTATEEGGICSFCGKRQGDREVDVRRLIVSGPTGPTICEECVQLAVHLLDDELGDSWLARY